METTAVRNPPSKNTSRRIKALDLIRTIAIAMVVLCHAIEILYKDLSSSQYYEKVIIDLSLVFLITIMFSFLFVHTAGKIPFLRRIFLLHKRSYEKCVGGADKSS